MAQLHQVITTISFFFFFVLVVSKIELSTCQVLLNGKVSCFDCASHHDLSGIMVQVKCNGVKNLATTMTKDALGSFQVELPSSTMKPTTACQAKLLGGPIQFYATKQNMVSEIVKAHDSSLTISTPLVVSTTCPKSLNHESNCGTAIEGSKTVDLPLPREWGLAPTSYYFPFFPIIGIP